MTKKIWIILLVIFTSFSIGITFADIVTHGIHDVDRCVKIVNPDEVPGYKLVMRRYEFDYGHKSYKVYDIEENKCLPTFHQGGSMSSDEFIYLIDENIDINTLNNLPLEDFETRLGKYFKFDEININGISLDNLNPVKKENVTYKVVEHGSGYKLKFVKRSLGVGSAANLELIKRILGIGSDNSEWETFDALEGKKLTTVAVSDTIIFSIVIGIGSWFGTILIETIILFLMAKLFRKKYQIPNRRLFLIGVLASTVTLPLLRFVIPLFIGYGVKYIIVGELLVTFIEIFIIKYGLKISRGKAILASIICNFCSFIIGEIINFFLLPF